MFCQYNLTNVCQTLSGFSCTMCGSLSFSLHVYHSGFFPLSPSSFAKRSLVLSKNILKSMACRRNRHVFKGQSVGASHFYHLVCMKPFRLASKMLPNQYFVGWKAPNVRCDAMLNESIHPSCKCKVGGQMAFRHHVHSTLTYLWSNDISLSLFHFFTRSFGSIHIITAVLSPLFV